MSWAAALPGFYASNPVCCVSRTKNLARWTSLNASAPSLLRCYAEWREILNHPLEEICSLLTLETEEARRLRQNSPFAGVLSAQEVWELKQRFRHATTPA